MVNKLIRLKFAAKCLSLLFISLVLISCSPQPVSLPSATTTGTQLPTKTITPLPTKTDTPTPIPKPSATPDLTILGNPSQKVDYYYPDWLPYNHFSYDEGNYFVFSKQLHGTDVVVAIHKDNPQDISYHKEFADFVWSTFHIHWSVLQGYPHETYYVKVLSPSSNQDFITATAIGFVVPTNPRTSNIGKSWYSEPMEYKQLVTHEMFHAWNGEIIMDHGNHINYVRPEVWFLEGATHYYGYRGTPNDLSFYQRRFNDSWQRYQGWKGTDYDTPVYNLSKLEESTQDHEYGQVIRDKGACLFYLMDSTLISMGYNLDDLLKFMYDNYGLEQKRYSTEDLLVALNTISGEDWTDFFDHYVYGNKPLPLDGNFIYLSR